MKAGKFTDETGSVRMVFWESDIPNMISGETHSLKRVIGHSYRNHNYITMNKQTLVEQSDATRNWKSCFHCLQLCNLFDKY